MIGRVDQYTVFEVPVSSQFRLSYEENFYHTSEYISSQPTTPQFSFCLCGSEQCQLLGKIHFYKQQGLQVISQLYAPFGSFDGKNLPKEIAGYFLESVMKLLAEKGIRGISVIHPSPCYGTGQIWEKLFTDAGFSAQPSVNYHLEIDKYPLMNKLHNMEKRKLSKGRHFEFSIQPIEALYDVYCFIESCRKERAQSLSLSFERMLKVVNNSPNNFLLCTVHAGNQLAAASVIIRVNSSCWYQFYPAHSKRFNKESPMVFLLSELYNFAQYRKVQILDLGTSELNGLPLQGLLKFKSRMGAVKTYKTLYRKSF